MPLLVYYPRHAVQNSASHVGIGPLCCYPGSISSSCKGMERCDRKWRLWEMVAGGGCTCCAMEADLCLTF